MKHAIGLIFGLLASHVTLPVFAGDQPDGLGRCFQRLAEPSHGTLVVEELVSYGVESLSFFYTKFDSISHHARNRFRMQVIPKLPLAETRDFILAESWNDTFEGRYCRLSWATAAIGSLEYSNGYDSVYPVLLRYRTPQFDLVQVLYKLDPGRALEDFTSWARSPDDALRFKGISAFREVGQTPPCLLLAPLIDDSVAKIQRQAVHFVSDLDLDCLGQLIETQYSWGIRYAAWAIGGLMNEMHYGSWDRDLEITDEYLAAVRLILRPAEYDDRLLRNERRFPDHALLATKQGAVLKVGANAYLLYNTEDETLREMSRQDPEDAQLMRRPEDLWFGPFAYGAAHWTVNADYMMLTVGIDSSSTYLLRKKDGRWSLVIKLYTWSFD